MKKVIPKETIQRVEKLRIELEKHRYKYHVLDNPEISDTAYDSLFKELEDLEQEFPEMIISTSPTQRVGGEPIKEFQKVRHEIRQWSFDDVFSFDELKKWDEKVRRMIAKESSLSKEKIEYCCEL